MSSKKHFISIKRGLSADSKHRERMGNRIWLFMHILDRVDWETGIAYDWRDKDEADDMGIPWRTLQKQRQELEDLGYIVCVKKMHGQDIIVYNWVNPRNYSGEVINPRPAPALESTLIAVPPSSPESTLQSTHQSTQHPYTDLGTPSIDSHITSHSTHLGADAPVLNSPPPTVPAQPPPGPPAGDHSDALRTAHQQRVAAAAASFQQTQGAQAGIASPVNDRPDFQVGARWCLYITGATLEDRPKSHAYKHWTSAARNLMTYAPNTPLDCWLSTLDAWYADESTDQWAKGVKSPNAVIPYIIAFLNGKAPPAPPAKGNHAARQPSRKPNVFNHPPVDADAPTRKRYA